MSDTIHTFPPGDLIEHVVDGSDCPCEPDVEPVQHEDGSIGWHVIHHPLKPDER